MKALNRKLELWDYQRQIVQESLKRKNVVIVLPQGTGKTVIGLNLIKQGNFSRTMILVHRKNLINSWVERAEEWLPGRLYVVEAGMKPEEKRKAYKSTSIIPTTVQLFRSDLKKCYAYLSDFDLVLIDECAETVAKHSGAYRTNVFYDTS